MIRHFVKNKNNSSNIPPRAQPAGGQPVTASQMKKSWIPLITISLTLTISTADSLDFRKLKPVQVIKISFVEILISHDLYRLNCV